MNWVSIGSDNGLSPGRRQAIIWTNADILSIRPQGTYFNEISFEILTFSFKKMCLNRTSAKWRPFYPGGDELSKWNYFSSDPICHVRSQASTNLMWHPIICCIPVLYHLTGSLQTGNLCVQEISRNQRVTLRATGNNSSWMIIKRQPQGLSRAKIWTKCMMEICGNNRLQTRI